MISMSSQPQQNQVSGRSIAELSEAMPINGSKVPPWELMDAEKRNILVVGSSGVVRVAYETIQYEHRRKLTATGYLNLSHEHCNNIEEFLNSYSQNLQAYLVHNYIDEVVIAIDLGHQEDSLIRLLADATEALKIKISLWIMLPSKPPMLPEETRFLCVPVMRYPFQKQPVAVCKRAFDIIVAVLALLVLMPLMCSVALIIKSTSNGPVLHKDFRGGVRGKPIPIYKFRSMVIDAERTKPELMKSNVMKGGAFKVVHDPRVTKFGKFIRKTSIDELPQIFSVLIGHLSIVGPRPIILPELTNLKMDFYQRHAVKPGLVCLWQICGRNQISQFEEWMRLDQEYVRRFSLFLDLSIFFKSFLIVLLGKGAS